MKKIDEFIEANLKVSNWGTSEVQAYCPLHHNTDTPSFSINRTTGLWVCFNPECGSKGSIHGLAKRLGVTYTGEQERDVTTDELLLELDPPEVEKEDWDAAMERVTIDYSNEKEAGRVRYLLDRGFHPAILSHFEIGYSELQERIVIPLRDESYHLVGFIGRATNEERKPKYKYSKDLPKAGVLFNLQNAKAYDTAIVTEGSLDCIKIHQAGFPNVVSVLGANVTKNQGELLNRYFNDLILFMDNDTAGEGGRRAIIDMCPGKNIWIVEYPDGIKDPGEMTEAQIRTALINKVDYLSYQFNNT